MPDNNVPAAPPVALGVNLYCEVVTGVSAIDVGSGRFVLRIGDEIVGVQIVGQLEVLRLVVTEAAAALGHHAAGGGD